ncbi:MAG: histidine kinase dimerization/phosphoacceptor domain -containing protein [Bacteroidota bacterium]
MEVSENIILFAIPGLLDNLTEGIVILNEDYEIIFANNILCSLTGLSKESLLQKKLEDILPQEKDKLTSLFNSSDPGNSFIFYTNLERKDGSFYSARIRIVKSTEKNSEAIFFIYIKDNSQYQRVQRDIMRKALSIEHLSKSRKIRDGKLKASIYEILEMASRACNTQRTNAWIFNDDHSQIHCIGNFDSIQNKLVAQDDLPRIDMPKYFKLFETKKLIITNDALNDPQTAELLDSYLIPNNICSLMDIPIRIEGDIVGILCFEHTHTVRNWNLQEQKFGLVIAQMISLAIETSEKKKAYSKLEIAYKEQKVLLQEVHHRVKNNLSIIASLLNLQATKANDEYHQKLFFESRNRINSIAAVHELLYQSESYSNLNFKKYLQEILAILNKSLNVGNKKIVLKTDLEDVHLEVSTAIPLALIVNEIVTNSYKHAFNEVINGIIEITLMERDTIVFLTIKDNGPGFEIENISKNSIGLKIVNGLIAQIGATLKYENRPGVAYTISFKKT